MIESTQIYAHFASEVYDDFGEVGSEQEYYRKEHADKELRKTKHALWIARAERAKERIDFWDEKPRLAPNKGYSINACKGMKKFSSRRTLQPIEWRNVYIRVEHLCREKAKEYELEDENAGRT